MCRNKKKSIKFLSQCTFLAAAAPPAVIQVEITHLTNFFNAPRNFSSPMPPLAAQTALRSTISISIIPHREHLEISFLFGGGREGGGVENVHFNSLKL